MGSVTAMYSEKIILKISLRLSFQCLSSFLGIENLVKCSKFMTGRFVSTLPEYLQLITDVIINFLKQRKNHLAQLVRNMLNLNA